MGIIQWNESLVSNIAEIDRQHQKLVAMINALHDAMRQGKGKDIIRGIVSELIDYTETHFLTEENHFIRFGYSEAESHKKEHAAFIRKVTEFNDKLQNGSITLSIEIMNFLSDWLQNHIRGTDRKYFQFFKEKGLGD
jgi:hemerythrin